MDVEQNLTKLLAQAEPQGKELIKQIFSCLEENDVDGLETIKDLFTMYRQTESDEKLRKLASQTEEAIMFEVVEESLVPLNEYPDELGLKDFDMPVTEEAFAYLDRINERVKYLEERIEKLERDNEQLRDMVDRNCGLGECLDEIKQ